MSESRNSLGSRSRRGDTFGTKEVRLKKNYSTRQRVAIISVLAGIIVGYLGISWRSLLIAHARGDQSLYTALAMKLDTGQFKDYNLRYVEVELVDGFSTYVRGKVEQGELLQILQERGIKFYDEPLFHTPPLFPYILHLSHRWLAADEPYRLLAVPEIAQRRLEQEDIALRQLDPCVIPILFGVLLVLATYWLGRTFANDVVGLGAAAVIAFSPAFLLASQRIWADTLLAALTCLAVLLAERYRQRPQFIWLVLSAVALGLALLTKVTAILIFVPVLLLLLAAPSQHRLRQLVIYVGVVAIVSAPWYFAVYRAYGTPIYAPRQTDVAAAGSFFASLQRLPWYSYLAGLPLQVPVFAIGYVIAFRLWRPLGSWFIVYLVALTIITKTDPTLGPEQRYLLPAYPALAVLSVIGLREMHEWLNRRCGRWPAHVATGVVLLASLAWAGVMAARSLAFDDVRLPF